MEGGKEGLEKGTPAESYGASDTAKMSLASPLTDELLIAALQDSGLPTAAHVR